MSIYYVVKEVEVRSVACAAQAPGAHCRVGLRILLVGEHFRSTIVGPMTTFSLAAGEIQLRRRLERAPPVGPIEAEQDH